MMRRKGILLLIFISYVTFCSLLQLSYAKEITSDQYVISEPFLEIDPEVPESATVVDTYSLLKNNTERAVFSQKGYAVRKIPEPLEGSIDNARVQLSKRNEPNWLEQSTSVSVLFSGNKHGVVTIGQIDELRSLSGQVIRATACDRVKNPCTRSHAMPWHLNSSLGLGYSLDNGETFKPFARLDRQEYEEVVLKKDYDNDSAKGQMTIGVRKKNTDTVETYQSVIQITTSLIY